MNNALILENFCNCYINVLTPVIKSESFDFNTVLSLNYVEENLNNV